MTSSKQQGNTATVSCHVKSGCWYPKSTFPSGCLVTVALLQQGAGSKAPVSLLPSGMIIIKRTCHYDRAQERFYDEAQAAKQHRYQFLPFGAGPRMCLGAGFAQVLSLAKQPLRKSFLPLCHSAFIGTSPAAQSATWSPCASRTCHWQPGH